METLVAKRPVSLQTRRLRPQLDALRSAGRVGDPSAHHRVCPPPGNPRTPTPTPHPSAPTGTLGGSPTPEGAVTLNAAPVEPPAHAKGPLVYDVFGAPGTNRRSRATKDLKAKATEAAQFCEGYTEP